LWIHPAFTFFNSLMLADLVGYNTSTCSDSTADEGAFASARKSPNSCAACCGTADSLSGVVMTSVVGVLFALCFAVSFVGLCQ